FDAWPTVAERLSDAGYETAAFYSNPWLADTTSGLLHGFESRWSTVPENGGEIVSAVGQWLDERDRSRPFFLFVNLLEAHVPYDPPPEIRATLGLPQGPVVASEWVLDYQARLHDPRRVRWDGYRQLYAGDVRWADLWFGELVGRLRGALGDRGFDEDLATLVTSDHGELLGEDGLVEHQLVLHDDLLAVPLVVRAPGLTPERRDAPVSGVDIAPTLLDLAGVEDSSSEGRSLLDRSTADRSIFAEYSGPPVPLLDDLERRNPDLERDTMERRWRAVRRGDDRLFVDSLGGARTILSSSEAQPQPLHQALREVFGDVVPPPRDAADPFEIDEASRERLRALGYIP
ncbi:MAG: sulfatase-like hydrolase/transferase, partial [Acidobacteriota bacterium]